MVNDTEWIVEYRNPNLVADCLARGVFVWDGPKHPQHNLLVERLDGDIYTFHYFIPAMIQ